jgi:lysine 2,3-aminomutase
MLNTMDETDLWNDPVRRYMLPAFATGTPEWPNHPKASRDSLHEAEMWAVEGLTHRYPTKVLAEMLPTCPQYCGHCTRMDLVGNDVPQVQKHRFQLGQKERYEQMLDYLRRTPTVRDVVVSGGDIANLPIQALEPFVSALLDIPNIRDIRLASKGLMAIPQHFLQDSVLQGLERLAKKANERGVDLALHTPRQQRPSAHAARGQGRAQAARHGLPRRAQPGCAAARREQHPQGSLGPVLHAARSREDPPVLLLHVRHDPQLGALALSVAEAQQLQHDIMGYMPGFATPRIVCDVPFVGKRWIHQISEYDRERGISYWTKNYRTGIEGNDPEALTRKYEYFDPIYTLPESVSSGGAIRPRRRDAVGSAPLEGLPQPSGLRVRTAGPLPRGHRCRVGGLALAAAPRRAQPGPARAVRAPHRRTSAPECRRPPRSSASASAVLPVAPRPEHPLCPIRMQSIPVRAEARIRPGSWPTRSARTRTRPEEAIVPQVPGPGALPRAGYVLRLLPPLHAPTHHQGR